MASNIVLSYILWFGAVIALICAVYVALGMRRLKLNKLKQTEKEE